MPALPIKAVLYENNFFNNTIRKIPLLTAKWKKEYQNCRPTNTFDLNSS